MKQPKAWRILFRLEFAEALRSRWVLFAAGVYGLLFAGFVWFGLSESSVLGFTGLSRVVLNIANAVVLAIPLVALVATSQVVVRARQSGFFELMLTQPVRRRDWFIATVASRFLMVLGPLLVLFVGAAIASAFRVEQEAGLAAIVARCLLVTVSLGWAFLGLGFWTSSVARTPERAMVLALLLWLVSSALHDFALVGALLRFKWPPAVVFGLAAVNPVETARIAVLGCVDPELSVLGPVGFWLANTLGPKMTLALGIVWPAFIGTVSFLRAERHLYRADLVG
ncbi:MAG: ABC transporter permease subunit [Polyangiaceae bacterium]|nr:ABC transporter permease subunit [Polyangiaceae bacterium]